MTRRAYLAGPDVFLSDAVAVGSRKKELCGRYGLSGHFPLDNDLPPQAMPIYRANVALIRSCDLVIANLTPFRGPSADAGTVFEVGYAAALGLPVWGYSADGRIYADKTSPDRYAVEDFGLTDNLMIPCAIAEGGGQIVTTPSPADDLAAFAAFEACLAAIKASLG